MPWFITHCNRIKIIDHDNDDYYLCVSQCESSNVASPPFYRHHSPAATVIELRLANWLAGIFQEFVFVKETRLTAFLWMDNNSIYGFQTEGDLMIVSGSVAAFRVPINTSTAIFKTPNQIHFVVRVAAIRPNTCT